MLQLNKSVQGYRGSARGRPGRSHLPSSTTATAAGPRACADLPLQRKAASGRQAPHDDQQHLTAHSKASLVALAAVAGLLAARSDAPASSKPAAQLQSMPAQLQDTSEPSSTVLGTLAAAHGMDAAAAPGPEAAPAQQTASEVTKADSSGADGALKPPTTSWGAAATAAAALPPRPAGLTAAHVVLSSAVAGPSWLTGRGYGIGSTMCVAATSAAAAVSDEPVLPTTWNDFQKANKGKGWSPSLMGQKWREHKARYLTGASNRASSSGSGGGVQLVAAAAATPATAAAPADAGADVLPTEWNDFQKANKGKGWSPSLMGQKWREHKARYLTGASNRTSGSSSSMVVAAAAPATPAPAAAPADAGADVLPTSWNDFQKANKGKGWSPSLMGQKWREHKARYLTGASNRASGSSSSMVVAAAAPATPAPAAAPADAGADVLPTSWNDFQKANKGKGWSPSLMGQKWREHKARYLTGASSRASSSSSGGGGGVQLVAAAAATATPATPAPAAAVPLPRAAVPADADARTTGFEEFQKANRRKGWSAKRLWREYSNTQGLGM